MNSEAAKEHVFSVFLEFIFNIAKIDKSKFDNKENYQEHFAQTPNKKCYIVKYIDDFFIRLEWLSKDPEPEFEILDLILENKQENITVLKYKKLLRDICKIMSVDHGDYHIKKINLRELQYWLSTNMPCN